MLLFRRFFGGFGFNFGSQNGGGNQRGEVVKGAEVVMDLEVTLEELYTGEFVEVCFKIRYFYLFLHLNASVSLINVDTFEKIC